MVPIAVWSLTALVTLAGLAGVVIPLLPGTSLILLGFIVHKLLLPESVTWAGVGVAASLWLLSLLVDFLSSVFAVRVAGGSRWGMAGAAAGSLVGMFMSLGAILLGSILGAVLAERLLGRRDLTLSIRAGIAAGVGFLVGIFLRVVLAFGMILSFLVSAWIAAVGAPAAGTP